MLWTEGEGLFVNWSSQISINRRSRSLLFYSTVCLPRNLDLLTTCGDSAQHLGFLFYLLVPTKHAHSEQIKSNVSQLSMTQWPSSFEILTWHTSFHKHKFTLNFSTQERFLDSLNKFYKTQIQHAYNKTLQIFFQRYKWLLSRLQEQNSPENMTSNQKTS